MSKSQTSRNPFYILLLIAGIAFGLTATAYGVMSFKAVRGQSIAQSGSGLLTYLDRYGAYTMAAELAVLAVACTAAMLTDDYWNRRSRGDSQDENGA